MSFLRSSILWLAALFLCVLPLRAEVASFSSAADVPVTAASYDATGQTLSVTLNFAPPVGTNLTVIRNTGLPFIAGEFTNVPNGATVNLTYNGTTYPFVAWYYGGNGNDLVLLWPYTGLAAWGNNESGQLGDGTLVNRNVPVAVKQTGALAGKTIVRVVGSTSGTRVLSTEGRVYTFGIEPSEISVEPGVSALAGKTVVAITSSHALCSDGTLTTLDSPPRAVNSASGALVGKTVVAIAGGYGAENVALCSDGTPVMVYGTGINTPPFVVDSTPASALFGKSVVSVSGGILFYLAVCSDGTVASWGYNFGGALGDGTIDPSDGNSTYRYPPGAVSTQPGVSSLFGKSVVSGSSGAFHNVALCSDGTIASWGVNAVGQLGNYSNDNSSFPVTVFAETGESALFGKSIRRITTGAHFGMALCSDGTLATWGSNRYGALGDGTNQNSTIPISVDTSSSVSRLHGVNVHSLAEPGPLAYHAVVIFGGKPLEVELEVLEPSVRALANGVDTADFGPTPFGGVRTFRVRNSSGGPLANVRASKSGANSSEFTIVSQPPATLAAGDVGTFQVAFVPEFSGPRTAKLDITSEDAAGGAFTVDLAATGLPPQIDVQVLEPTVQTLADGVGVVDFGVAVPGTRRTIRVTNSGNTSLHNLSVAKSGTDAADFSILSQPATTLAIGASSTFQVAFSTAIAGTKTATLQIASDDPDEAPFDIALVATILPGEIDVDVVEPTVTSLVDGVSTVDYGSCLNGTLRTFRIQNTGMLPLTGISAAISGVDSGAFSILGQPPTSIPPGQEASFRVAFSSAGAGGKNAALQITSSDLSEAVFDITLAGSSGSGLSVVFAQPGEVGLTTTSPSIAGASLSVTLGFAPQQGTNLTVIRNNSPAPFDAEFGGFANGATVLLPYNGTAYPFVVWYYGGDGNDLMLLWPYTGIAAWGGNSSGQLGDGTKISRVTPGAVTRAGGWEGKTVVQVARGGYHMIALTSDGEIYSWGFNGSGQLGDGTFTERLIPTRVTASVGTALFGKRVISVSAGAIFSVALCSDGTVATWGANFNGTLGNGTSGSFGSRIPVAVSTANGSSALFGKFVTSVSAGTNHCLALCSDGTVVGWGSNEDMRLGDPVISLKVFPTAVDTRPETSALFGKTVMSVSAGDKHSLALCTDGTAVAWGRNWGLLGIDSAALTSLPAVVSNGTSSGLSGKVVVSLKAGTDFSAAVCSDGTLVEWGENANGQLGLGDQTDRLTPTMVPNVQVTAVELGSYHTLSLLPDGSVTSWGGIGVGGIGVGSTTSSSLFTGRRIGAISSGPGSFNSAVIYGLAAPEIEVEVLEPSPLALADGANTVDYGTVYPGTVRTFRVSNAGESELVGLSAVLTGADAGDFTVLTPLPAAIRSGATAVLRVALTAQTDGLKNATLQILSNDLDEGVFDVAVTGSRIGTLSAVFNSANDIGVVTDSFSASGMTLDVTLNFAPSPGTELTVLRHSGTAHILGTFSNAPNGGTVNLSFDGKTYPFVAWYFGGDGNDLVLVWKYAGLRAWGSNASGMVGDGTVTQQKPPTATDQSGALAGKTIVQIARGSNHILALSAEGRVYSWGSNGSGQLGNGSGVSIRVPTAVDVGTGSALFGKTVTAVAAGQRFSLARCSDGTVVAWGENVSGQLGDATTNSRTLPVAVNVANGTSALFGKTVTAISAGNAHSIALCSDGTVAAWGDNLNGQVGDNSTFSARNAPVAVTTTGVSALAGRSATAIAAGSTHSLALCADGQLVAWGNGVSGQLGNGLATTSRLPLAVTMSGLLGGRTVTAIDAGGSFCMALCSDGTLAAWGSNANGRLGDGTTTNRSVPTAVSTASGLSALFGKTVKRIAAGSLYNSALCTDGTYVSWGANASGQIADGTTIDRNYPTAITLPISVSGIGGSGAVAGTSFAIYGIDPAENTILSTTSVAATSATLNGIVNPRGNVTLARFEYGTTSGFGSSADVTLTPNNGSIPQSLSKPLTGLLPMTTYYFRLSATTLGFTTYSSTASFTTGSAPTLTLPVSPLIAEATGPAGATVTFNVVASDEQDGALIPSVSHISGGVFAIGDTTVSVSATDSSGETTASSFVVRVADTIAPTVTHANELIAATGPDGAVINYGPAAASDLVGVTELTYEPTSGTLFPIGVTTVTVSARDAAGNTGSANFIVRVVPSAPVRSALGSKGGAVPGAGVGGSGIPAGAVWATFGVPSVNDAGQAAVLGTFKAGTVSTTAILAFDVADTSTMRVVVKKGDAAPGVTNAVMSSLKDPLLAPDGAVAWLATLANLKGTTGAVLPVDNAAIFLDADGPGAGSAVVVARNGTAAAGAMATAVVPPGVDPLPEWGAFTSVALGSDALAFTASLAARTPGLVGAPGPGGVTSATDSGLWVYRRSLEPTTTLALREGDALLGSTVKLISALVARPGSSGQGRGVESDGSQDYLSARVTLADARQTMALIGQDGAVLSTPYVSGGDAAGFGTGALWQTFGKPTQNSVSTAAAFLATVKASTGTATTLNNVAIFAEDDIDYIAAKIVGKGDVAPGVSGGLFSTFNDPVSASNRSVAFAGAMKTVVGVTTAANNDGIWWNSPTGLTLVAREGAQPPEAPAGAQWKAFTSLALPDGRGPIFVASMHSKIGTASPGPGGVTTANDVGLWATDSFGALRLLMREGDAIGSSTVRSFTVLSSVLGSPAQTRSFNSSGSVIVRVTDALNAQHLVLIAVP